ncbi:Bud site selection protein 21 [Candida viswanathii]|uniref:Bud site selection protein 21 n=1 Tax=Candida viswanathii TaxID=5486 RepID=A0A367YPI4_9ASCO|nr:Bud site selection protein 21 [Candida viswanathii]
MVVTRSQSQPIRKKFTDDDFIDEEIVPREEAEEEESEEEEESDDDAPEEESTSRAKEDALVKEKQRQEEEADLERQRKERRRALDLRNKQQQEEKKKKKINLKKQPIELPEFLPDDIESIMKQQESDVVVSVPQSKHIRLDEDAKADRKAILEEKLRQLKQKKKTAVKKGPVFVQVQANSNKKIVPKSESKIVKNRDKWLHRKSINRK